MSNPMPPSFKLRPAGLACVLALAPLAHAGSSTGTLGVSLVLVEHCQTRSDPEARPVDFGAREPGSTHAGATSAREALAIRCSAGYYPSVTVQGGANDDRAPRGTHAMVSQAGDVLAYRLYADAGRRRPLDAGDAIALIAGTGEDGSQHLHLYGKAMDATQPAAGSYADTVVVQLTF